MYFSTQQTGSVVANLVPGILYMLEITFTNIRTIRIEPVSAGGNVPEPLNPGDNNKVLTASGGTFSWQSIPSQLPTINNPADNGKVLIAQSGSASWQPRAVPTPLNPGDNNKVLTASGGSFSWQSIPSQLPTINNPADNGRVLTAQNGSAIWQTPNSGGAPVFVRFQQDGGSFLPQLVRYQSPTGRVLAGMTDTEADTIFQEGGRSFHPFAAGVAPGKEYVRVWASWALQIDADAVSSYEISIRQDGTALALDSIVVPAGSTLARGTLATGWIPRNGAPVNADFALRVHPSAAVTTQAGAAGAQIMFEYA
jgi:hypothetical protein